MMWNKRTPLWVRIAVWWQLRSVPKSEFHVRLNYNTNLMLRMACACERDRYRMAVQRNRRTAHLRDLEDVQTDDLHIGKVRNDA